jgi:selenocysteine lyase/cysteine desulfurase
LACGAAIDYLFKVGIPGIAAYEHALLEYATQALATIPGLRPIGTAATKASVLAFVIPGLPNESIARHLDKNGIAVRAGASLRAASHPPFRTGKQRASVARVLQYARRSGCAGAGLALIEAELVMKTISPAELQNC